VAAADHHAVTQAQLRELMALQDERVREQDRLSEMEMALDAKKDKRRGELARSLVFSTRSCVRLLTFAGLFVSVCCWYERGSVENDQLGIVTENLEIELEQHSLIYIWNAWLFRQTSEV